jgi:hypothetical protein
MRTTLDVDEDVLAAAKELASARKSTAGKILSQLARKALIGPAETEPLEYRNGVPLLPRAGMVITSEMVERWLEEDV